MESIPLATDEAHGDGLIPSNASDSTPAWSESRFPTPSLTYPPSPSARPPIYETCFEILPDGRILEIAEYPSDPSRTVFAVSDGGTISWAEHSAVPRKSRRLILTR